MSLKDFHVVFITASILLSLGFAYWGFVQYMQLRGGMYVGAALISLLSAIGLVVYEVAFIKKTRSQNGR